MKLRYTRFEYIPADGIYLQQAVYIKLQTIKNLDP